MLNGTIKVAAGTRWIGPMARGNAYPPDLARYVEGALAAEGEH